ncbi:4-alpha-glucanotransferase [Sphingomonas morindae]|uniref:4-alpha-glucanotransferase n=1 Tax=Sphingomonas morindae TaxID=1541170 RepID=A0ABY4X462_9SPHN|nr:4-alpha-glucanotransferase [Sphingomonas morindae]USI71679.1 4-alpha-glucanotransferase [Sphingomonas morindae]
MSDAALIRLAARAGLLAEWRDFENRPQTVAPDTLRAVLGAMGLPAGSEGEIADSSARLDARAAVPHFVTGDIHHPSPVALDGLATLTLEDGRAFECDPRQLTIHDCGYHRLRLGAHEIGLAIAPARAPSVPDLTGRDRAWGAAVQLYALRGDAPRGFGDLGQLGAFARAAAAAGADALAVSPAHALFSADPGRYSPYSPSSRDFLNILYADPEADEPAGGDLIDWPEAAAARLAGLRRAYAAFEGDAGFDAFVAEGGAALRGHALFEALDHHFRALGHGSGWQAWPSAYHDPASPAVAEFARAEADAVRFHLFLQWRADRGLARAQAGAKQAGMAIGLISDLAVGLDTGGSHAWSRRGELIAGLTIGAPPDAFQAEGQGWGITGFSPIALEELGFLPYLRTLRTALRHAGGVRIDHALGLGRLWVIPEGARPLDGCYMRYPFEDMMRLLALEAARHRALVIGEDLGVVPEGFRDRLAERHLLGMSILLFERDNAGRFTDPRQWRRASAAMTTTHDLTPVGGWWKGVDIEWRTRLGIGAESAEARAHDRDLFAERARQSGAGDVGGSETAVDAGIALVARSACELAIVPAEDLFGLSEAPNMPGTIDEHPNWRRRYPAPAETLFADPAAERRTTLLREQRS